MGATYRRRDLKRGRRSWLVTIHFDKQREFATVYSEQDARDLVRQIHKQELAGINVVETIRAARAPRVEPGTPEWPTLAQRSPPTSIR
jgi:hypothetical protein